MLFLWSLLIARVAGACHDHSPAFPVPQWKDGTQRLDAVFQDIQAELDKLWNDDKYNTASISVELTSQHETLASWFHTAKVSNDTRPGDRNVGPHSLYRIASITKTFTTLAVLQLHDQGKLSIEDPVTKYVPELREAKAAAPWKDISLRTLASQLSGIPREFAQSDMLDTAEDPTAVGLPPADPKVLPKCHRTGTWIPCTRDELLDFLAKEAVPIFAPNQKSTYSNVNFELLGIVIENVSGLKYEEYIETHIFQPVGMGESRVSAPRSDKHSVLPAIGWTYWDVDAGALNPTGGIYSSSADMSKYLRHILTHYNTLATGVNWLMPASWTGGLHSFYGMPWEIFRTDRILQNTKRPVTFVTKSGSLPGYVSRVVIMEEYGLGLTILVGGDNSNQPLNKILEIVSVKVTRAAEDLMWQDVEERYTGSFQATNYPHLNSSLVLESSPSDGLVLSTFISNSTNFLSEIFGGQIRSGVSWKLFPTLLYKNETARRGEIWMAVPLPDRTEPSLIWDDFCVTDIDIARYAGVPANEVVFWEDEIELPAFQVKMKRVTAESGNAVWKGGL